MAAHLATLNEIAALDADWVVASHAPPTRDGAELAAANKSKILEIGERIFELIPVSGRQPATPEVLVTALANALGLELNHTQYALLGFTLKSYISWLADRGEILTRLESNRLLVERNKPSCREELN